MGTDVVFPFYRTCIKIYLNERPFEPRERDYALVGSFYVFAIWIGMGTFALIQNLRNTWSNKLVVPASVLLCFLAVPVLMGVQNWDDHDRSGRYTAQSISKSYLTSIQKDVGAIIFTIGDNDTFAFGTLKILKSIVRMFALSTPVLLLPIGISIK